MAVSRLAGGRAAGVCGVDGCAIGVWLVPVLFESFPDSALGGGELNGRGLVLLVLLVSLGGWVLSEHGGPGVSVPAPLCSGAPPSGPSDLVVLGSLGRVRGMGSRPVSSTGQALRGNDDLAGLRVNGACNELRVNGPFDRLRVNGPFDGLRVNGPFDGLRVNGPFDRLRVNGPFDKLRVNGPFDRLRVNGPFDKLRVNGPFDRLRVNGPFDKLRVNGPFDRLRVNGPFDKLRVNGACNELRVNGACNELRVNGPFDRLRVNGPFDPFDRLRGAGLRVNGACNGLFVADYVYYELLGGGDPVVGLEAVVPVLHYVVEELDDGDAVGRLGSDEPGHEEFIYPREHSEEVLRKGGRGVQGHGHQAPLRGGAGVGRVGASIDGVTA